MQPNKLLIIHESDSTRNYLQRTLQEAGFETLHPQLGVIALDAIRQLQPDLVILACEAIDEAGLEVVRAIRADAELYRLPVIMVGTAFDPDAIAAALLRLHRGTNEGVEIHFAGSKSDG